MTALARRALSEGASAAWLQAPPFHAAMRWYGVLTPSGW
ncbi:hypothetical protein AB0H92_36745 [Streptomyces phaeochromogenes]